jgi:N-acetylglucosaminyl-diphospho-decaprenol L-rhamnosyltransferase
MQKPSSSDVAAVVVTYNALAYLERCLESVAGHETVVVDHGSTDGTLELVRERFPSVRLVEQENRGLAAGWNRGIGETTGRYVLLLNSDAWMKDGAVARLGAFADEHPDAAVVGPRLLNPDGTLQPSVRAFPTMWRLTTEYFGLRKLAPHTRALNEFYGGGFDHESTREVDFVKAACLLVRRSAIEEVGPADESFFLFSEEVDWCYRFRQSGWKVFFFPGAEVTHVGGGSWRREFDLGFREQLRGHVRFFAKHRGMKEAERVRRLLIAGLRLRSWLMPGRRSTYREAAGWLASTPTAALLESSR